MLYREKDRIIGILLSKAKSYSKYKINEQKRRFIMNRV